MPSSSSMYAPFSSSNLVERRRRRLRRRREFSLAMTVEVANGNKFTATPRLRAGNAEPSNAQHRADPTRASDRGEWRGKTGKRHRSAQDSAVLRHRRNVAESAAALVGIINPNEINRFGGIRSRGNFLDARRTGRHEVVDSTEELGDRELNDEEEPGTRERGGKDGTINSAEPLHFTSPSASPPVGSKSDRHPPKTYIIVHLEANEGSATSSPAVAMGCLIMPALFALWWMWTKRKAKKIIVRLIRQEAEVDMDESEDAYTSWDDVMNHDVDDPSVRFVRWIKGRGGKDGKRNSGDRQRYHVRRNTKSMLNRQPSSTSTPPPRSLPSFFTASSSDSDTSSVQIQGMEQQPQTSQSGAGEIGAPLPESPTSLPPPPAPPPTPAPFQYVTMSDTAGCEYPKSEHQNGGRIKSPLLWLSSSVLPSTATTATKNVEKRFTEWQCLENIRGFELCASKHLTRRGSRPQGTHELEHCVVAADESDGILMLDHEPRGVLS